ncbi:MAG: NADH-quinone oxidoreductase, chain [Actinomycetia bacterium]|nr:NADH-quinone oxidoreductase, chain [Actinomycetes bacterium]
MSAELVTLTIDGKEITAPKGVMLIQAAQDAGIFIPRFCWHERMKAVGMCRMCLVEIDGVRGLPPACTTPVADGMVVHLQKDNVQKAQDGVLEFLLINHPLDCPVCDRGGECPLQDQTLAFGPGESRFVEEKRHFVKPIEISPNVLLDRERCIQCARCTRFADEIAGDPLITFVDRGDRMEVNTFPEDPFISYFSGNVVQICPVGALTAKPYRFRARPWDLQTSETTCQGCSVGCRGAVQSSSNRLVRLLGVDLDPVNQGWLCDKGRFGFEYVHAPERIREPLVRVDADMVEQSWPLALEAASEGIRKAIDLHGPGAVAVIGGAHGSNEDAYVWARFAKGVLRTDNVDAQLGDGLPPEVVNGLPEAAISDCDTAAAIVLLAPDLKEELPVLYLRVRRAATDLGVPLIDLSSREHGLTKHATATLRTIPGQQAAAAEKLLAGITSGKSSDPQVRAAIDAMSGRDGEIVVILGRPSMAESQDHTVAAAAALAASPRTRFLSALRRSNVRGALDLGLSPGTLPGRVTLEAGRAWFDEAWGGTPETAGLDTAGILQAAKAGKIHALVLLGADPLADFPDRKLAREGLDAISFVVAVDAFANESNRRADVFLPVTLWGEKSGSTTNIEGRIQRLGRRVAPEGTAMDDWRIAVELAFRFGVDLDLETVDEVTDEIARLAPAHRGVTSRLLVAARDGVVVPVAEHRDALVFTNAVTASEFGWDPIRPGTVEDESFVGAQLTNVVEASGTGAAGVIPSGGQPSGEVPSSEEIEAFTAVDDSAAPAVPLPELMVWDRSVTSAPAPPPDGYALRLVAGRKLYDAGRVTMSSPALANLAPSDVLLVNPADRDRIGVADGGNVRVISARGATVLAVRGDEHTPAGTAFMLFDQPGEGAADVIDINQSVMDLRLESLS